MTEDDGDKGREREEERRKGEQSPGAGKEAGVERRESEMWGKSREGRQRKGW